MSAFFMVADNRIGFTLLSTGNPRDFHAARISLFQA
jgi:hypothetical protein